MQFISPQLPISRFPSTLSSLSPPLTFSSVVNFNRYVRLNGGVIGIGGRLRHCHNELVTSITDRTPVIRLLTTDSSREGGKTGWLCLVMKDIVCVGSFVD